MNSYKLKDLTTIYNGTTYAHLGIGDIPLYGSGGLMGYVDDALYEGEAVLLPRKGTLNNIMYVCSKFWTVDTMYYAKTNDKLVLPYYLYCYLSLLDLAHLDSGSTLPSMTKAAYNDIEVHLPSIEVQAKIVAVTRSLDNKIELNNRINAELEAMAKTLYDYWFVQFDFPDANGKPYKTAGGKMVYNETLKREIPEGWSDGAIQDVIGKVPQAHKVPAKEFEENGAIPVIDQSQKFICGFIDDEKTKIKPITAHVIFGDHTRAVKVVNFEYARGADGTQILVANRDDVPSYLLYQIVLDIDLSSYGYARHYKFLKDSKCVIPRASIAQRYQEMVKPWHEKVRANIFQNYELQRLRDWLLPMLMNGQVTVK